MILKNHTLIQLAKKVEALDNQMDTLKLELAANTQATEHNTIAVEGITQGLSELAKQTGDWRKDDAEHHQEESELNQQKIQEMLKLEQAVINLADTLNKKA